MQGKKGTHTKSRRYRPSRHEAHALDAYYDAQLAPAPAKRPARQTKRAAEQQARLLAYAAELAALASETEAVFQPTQEEWDAGYDEAFQAALDAEEAALVALEAHDDQVYLETLAQQSEAQTGIIAAIEAKIAQTEPEPPAPRCTDDHCDGQPADILVYGIALCAEHALAFLQKQAELVATLEQIPATAVAPEDRADAASEVDGLPFPLLMNVEVEAAIAIEQMEAEGFVWNGQTWVRPDDDPDPEPPSPASLPVPTPGDFAMAVARYDAWEQLCEGERYAARLTFWREYDAALPDILNHVDAYCDALVDVGYTGCAEQAAEMLSVLESQPSLPETIWDAPYASVLDPWLDWLKARNDARDALAAEHAAREDWQDTLEPVA